ncbi:hypothetical protein HUJ04_010932 [Dendroctonus ponderosae]|nr:hypothetical protein HUJ04_010932 [Dendroctonus ponderosae]KAH1028214.1 hypothetical protein HUJ05_001589 [Dendroctonus ponderosae]
MSSMGQLHVKLDYVHEELIKLTLMVGAFATGKTEDGMKDDWSSVFPILSLEQLNSLEAILELPGKVTSLMEYTKKIGGFTVTEITHRSMSRLLDCSVGARFSWLGKKGKLAFYTYRLAAVLKESILTNSRVRQQDTTERDVEKCMMGWLRHCPAKCQAATDKLEISL